jgi:predicted flavoprotein YhiN
MVMDTEVRAKIQTVFGLEVTDQKMEKLRTAATPHLKIVVDDVTKFFKERGITITNLGISGGFVYKDKSVMDKLVEVFNADQKVAIARAETAAQEETNKKIKLEATGKALALKLEKETEAEMIKLVADAKEYELDKASTDVELYTYLKRLELEKEKLKTWDGHFPSYYMGGGTGNTPDILLQIPIPMITRPASPKAKTDAKPVTPKSEDMK